MPFSTDSLAKKMIKTLLLKKLKNISISFLQKIYVKSEFIDPVDEIVFRINKTMNYSGSTPFLVLEMVEIVSFFTIESSNPNVTGRLNESGIYWLESFFITEQFLGKGYSKSVVKKMLQCLPIHFPTIISLNLTVNTSNEIAQNIYKKCGFIDTHKKYLGGPAGPQHIYKYILKC